LIDENHVDVHEEKEHVTNHELVESEPIIGIGDIREQHTSQGTRSPKISDFKPGLVFEEQRKHSKIQCEAHRPIGNSSAQEVMPFANFKAYSANSQSNAKIAIPLAMRRSCR